MMTRIMDMETGQIYSLVPVESQIGQPPELYWHIKSGKLYEVICNADMEATGESVVVYRNVKTGETWVQPADRFNDGRFELK